MLKILFVDEQSYDYDIEDNILPAIDLLFLRTFAACNIGTSLKFCCGNYTRQTKIPWITGIKEIIKSFKPDIIMVFSLPIDEVWVMDCFRELCRFSRINNIPLYSIWPDMVTQRQIDGVENIVEDVYRVLTLGCPIPKTTSHRNKFFVLFTPQDPLLFYNYPHKDIPLSFNGEINRRKERVTIVQKLRENNINIDTPGGRAEGRLSTERYADTVRRTQIGLNSCQHRGTTSKQIKGRTFEILASGGMLMDMDNPRTTEYLKEGKEYISFTIEDLVEKTQFYMQNETQRNIIAAAGNRRFREDYTHIHFWKRIIRDARINV